jgi:hypothetical protein
MLMDGYIYIYGCFLKWGYAKNAGWFMMEHPMYKWMMVPGVPPWIGNLQLGLVNLNFEKPCPWEGSTHYNHLTILIE